jgi:phage gp46-like protein
MSDIYIDTSQLTPDIAIESGDLKASSSIFNAVYLSLFTPPYWGNAIAAQNERYTSTIPDLVSGTVTNQTRLDMIAAAENALAWMVEDGVADRIEVAAEIQGAGKIAIAVTVHEPSGTADVYRFGVNWDATEAQA